VRWIIELADVEKAYWGDRGRHLLWANHVHRWRGAATWITCRSSCGRLIRRRVNCSGKWNVTPPPGPGVTNGRHDMDGGDL